MTDPEWKGLQESWRAQAPEQRARRHRLGARRVLLVDLAASALWFTLAASAALHSRERWVLLWALLVCLLSATALGYSLWNRRDALLPSALAPLDFLAQAELRCRRQLELHRFLRRFGAAEVVISLLLFGWAAAQARDLRQLAARPPLRPAPPEKEARAERREERGGEREQPGGAGALGLAWLTALAAVQRSKPGIHHIRQGFKKMLLGAPTLRASADAGAYAAYAGPRNAPWRCTRSSRSVATAPPEGLKAGPMNAASPPGFPTV